MKKLLCPQCKVGIFCVKDAQGNRLPVYVSDQGEIVPKDETSGQSSAGLCFRPGRDCAEGRNSFFGRL